MKWLDCTFTDKFSSSFEHYRSYAKTNGWNIDFSTAEQKSIPWKNLATLENTQLIKVNITETDLLLKSISHHSTQVNLLGVFDYLIFEGNNFWPRIYLYEALRKRLVQNLKSQDGSTRAYVSGTNLLAVVGLGVLASLGYQELIWVGDDIDFASKKITFLKTKFLGINISYLETRKLTLENFPSPILINTETLEPQSDFFSSLCYFNYLSRNGIICDISSESTNSPLLKECQNAQVKSMALHEILETLEMSVLDHFS